MTDPTQLHAYADGESTPAEANALRELLRSDPDAAAEVDAILNLKEFLGKNAPIHREDEAWKGCLRRLDAIDKTRRVEGFVGRYAWALCGVLFLFIVSGRSAMRNVQGDTARTADLARIFGSSRPVSRVTQEQSKLYEELLKQVGPNLDPTSIEAGRPTYGLVRDMAAVRVPLRDRQGDLAITRIEGVLNLQDTTPSTSNPAFSIGVANGENCLVWHSGGYTYLLSGSRSLTSLNEIAARIFGSL